MLKLSLIIPVYNEERHIDACLNAVAKQTVKPFEVLVVDNNCSDKTLEIAEKYKFVTILHEQKQGLIHARNCGFNHAKGDILGRIDADSVLNPDWIENVLKTFDANADLSGITGIARTDFIPYSSHFKSKIFTRAYFWFIDANLDTVIMWGANMAIRKNSWQTVKNDVTLDDKKVHEDIDLSLWMAAKGFVLQKNKSLLITTNGQSYRYLPKLYHYYQLLKKTKHLHKMNGNLYSPAIHRIGFWKTFPGRVLSYVPSFYLVTVSVLLFPVDYYMFKKYSAYLR
jgi:glycosyltransferase involved in cell wall biosynthesis